MVPDATTLPSAAMPLAVLLPAAGVLAFAWVRSHVWSRAARGRWNIPLFAGRTGLGFLTLSAAAGAAQTWVTFAAGQRLWPILLCGALLAEVVMAVGQLERHLAPRRAGVALSLLRVLLVLAVTAMLCQPVLVFEQVRRIQRHVAILLDVSGSMRVADNNLTPAEKTRLAEALYASAPKRPFAFDRTAASLRKAGQDLQVQTDWLASLADTDPALRTRQLSRTASAFRKAVQSVRATAAETARVAGQSVAAPFLKQNDALRSDLAGLATQLAGEIVEPLDAALKLTSDWRPASTNCAAAYETVRETLKRTSAGLAAVQTRLAVLADSVDAKFYQSLPAAGREAIDRTAALPRTEVARGLWLGMERAPAGKPPEKSGAPSLLDTLDRTYGVRLYTFGARPSEMKLTDLPFADLTNTARAATRDIGNTDIAQALEKVSADIPPEETAGIILVSDGRHHAASAVEPLARKLGLQQVPVFPVTLGGNSVPPTDAAVAAVHAPESVSTNDRAAFTIDLKLDGLAGTNVVVTLFDGDTAVASNTVTPPSQSYRKDIQLSTAPKTNGLHEYRVEVSSFADDVNAGNNVYRAPVLVHSDRLNVLLVEGVPRWEFRYLKNLFMERDKTVQLQHLLLHPDRIDGFTNRPSRAAAASPVTAEPEAALFPANESEWNKFDVIVLGDVDPAELGRQNMAILKNYVTSRGGSLIVIAGRLHMPHRYAGTPLAEILPVTFTPSSRPYLAAPETGFRLALTAQGRNTVFMKLDDDPARNQQAWDTLPTLYWRHGTLTAKAGASVLAYAVPTQPELAAPASPPDGDALLSRQQYERDHALIVTHQAGFGPVLMFNLDQTWRMRYRKGDALHHKFWGQILRWATADRIASGSARVRISAGRPRYAVGEPVRLQARLATPDLMPVTNATLHATVWSGDRKILRRPLLYRAGSPGVYTAETGPLPDGRYRVEIETAGVRELAGVPPRDVTADFSVTAAADSETVELSADRGLLSRIASLTAGDVLDPTELDSLAARLGPAVESRLDRRQIDLWNSWPWFLLIVALLTAEWLVRKKVRLP